MTLENVTKINKLIRSWPKGTVCTSNYLRKQGYKDDLVWYYKKSHWIESIGRGAYKLFGDLVDWYGGVYAIQKQLQLNIHVAAKTALTLQGYGHYLSPTLPQCHLFGRRGDKLPVWFKTGHWDSQIVYTPTILFSENSADTFVDFSYRDFSIRLSAPERAAMEMCYLVPKRQGFDEAGKIMENLSMLRPEWIQILLEDCCFIKVKRLFMYFAEKADHGWLKKLDPSRVNFGSGERQIVKEGVLDRKYLITVPKSNGYENFDL